jgi:hypothetical protein
VGREARNRYPRPQDVSAQLRTQPRRSAAENRAMGYQRALEQFWMASLRMAAGWFWMEEYELGLEILRANIGARWPVMPS